MSTIPPENYEDDEEEVLEEDFSDYDTESSYPDSFVVPD